MGRYRFIAAEKANWSVRRLCSALRVSRAGYYAWASDTARVYDRENTKLGVHIRAIYRRSRETYGAPRITRELRDEGWTVSRKRVARRGVDDGQACVEVVSSMSTEPWLKNRSASAE